MFEKSTAGKTTNISKRRNVAIGFGVAILMLSILLTGCQESQFTIESLLVPEKADAIAKVKIAEILNDEDIADLYAHYAVTDRYAPQTLRLALDALKEETGVDVRYFNEAVLFADTSTIEAQVPYFGAIVECNIPAQYFFQVLGQLGGINFETQKYGGYKIYTLDGEVSIVFLNKELMAVGPINVVRDVIDVGLGKGRPISGKPYELYDALDNSLFKGASKVSWTISREIPREIPFEGQNVVDLDPLRDVDMTSCIFDKKGSTISIRVYLHFGSNSLATDASESIEDLITWAKYTWPLPELRNMVDRIHIVVYNSQVLVELEVTVSEIHDLIDALERGNLL